MTFNGLCHSICYADALPPILDHGDGGARALIVHHHLFKHAGSTIDDALRRNFGRGFLDDRSDRRLHASATVLGQVLEGNQTLQCVSSHLLRLPLPDVLGRRLLKLVMLRHPIERVISVYKYERAKRSSIDPHFTSAAVENNIAGFVERCLNFDMVPAIRNFHISQMLPQPVNWRKPFGCAELMSATNHLRSVELLGFVERFNESMVLFEHVLGPHFPGIDLACVRRNVTPGNRHSLDLRVESLGQDLGEDLNRRLMMANELDIQLYRAAAEDFENRLTQVPDLQARLVEYELRCSRRERLEKRLLMRVRRKLCATFGC